MVSRLVSFLIKPDPSHRSGDGSPSSSSSCQWRVKQVATSRGRRPASGWRGLCGARVPPPRAAPSRKGGEAGAGGAGRRRVRAEEGGGRGRRGRGVRPASLGTRPSAVGNCPPPGLTRCALAACPPVMCSQVMRRTAGTLPPRRPRRLRTRSPRPRCLRWAHRRGYACCGAARSRGCACCGAARSRAAWSRWAAMPPSRRCR